MDNVELSSTVRQGAIITGLLQRLVCYLLIVWPVGRNLSWIVYGISATVAFSSVLFFSAIFFKQKHFWGWLALVLVATPGVNGWLKWQTDGMNPWRAEKVLWNFGYYLLLMVILLLPWTRQSLRICSDSSRYRYFYQSVWHNILILLAILFTNGLTQLALLLWGELLKLVGITFFKTLLLVIDGFIYLMLGLVTALAATPARTQSRSVDFVQRLFTLIVMRSLPLASLLTLMFIIILPFMGLSAVSRRISAAGLLLALAFPQLILMVIVFDP